MTDTTPTLEVEEITVDFGGTEVLSDVSLSVDAGDLIGLVGPNGAGKTTLLRTINGRIEPTSGTVTVDATPVSALSAREIGRRIATVPQETGLSFSFPVREAVAMGRHPHIGRFGTADETDRELVETALERTELSALADRPVTELSGGERQRVLVARAFAQATPVLLLDEPTANLDINHAVSILDLVRAAADEGTAAVAAIHDLTLAARYCDRLVLLADGRIRAAGPPESVLTDETLTDAFGARTVVSEDPATGTPRVTALSEAIDDNTE